MPQNKILRFNQRFLGSMSRAPGSKLPAILRLMTKAEQSHSIFSTKKAFPLIGMLFFVENRKTQSSSFPFKS